MARRSRKRRRERREPIGFSVIELIVIVVVIGTLFAVGLPSRRKATDEAKDAVARANIRDVLYAELAWWAGHEAFTSRHSDLQTIEPALQLYSSSGLRGSVFIVLGRSSDKPALCLFAQGGERKWLTLYYSTVTGRAVSLESPEQCTRRMIDEQTGQKPPVAPDWIEPVPTDSIGPAVRRRR